MADSRSPDSSDDPTGKQPKSADRIRRALESVHGQVQPESVGEAHHGLAPDAQLIVATFHNPELAKSYQQALSQAGVMSSRRRAGRMTEISVDYEDRTRAHGILDEHRKLNPDPSPRGVRRDFDFMIFGIIIAGSASLVPLLGMVRTASDVMVIIAYIVTGAITGHLVDRIRGGYRRTGRFRMGVWEFLLLAAVPLLIIGLVMMTPRLIDR